MGFLAQLDDRKFEVTILSGAPEETFRLTGARGVPRKDMGQVNQAIEDCDIVVFPGGSVFQDSTSVRSPAYYNQIVRKAKKKGKTVVMLGQGVGPLNTFLGKRLAADAFNRADFVATRDPASAQLLKTLGVKKRVETTADMAFLLPRPAEDDASNYQLGQMRTVGLAPRPFGKGKEVVEIFGELARLLFQAQYVPVLIEMDRVADGPLIQEISKQQGGKVPDLRKLTSPIQIQQRLIRMDGIIAMRLHAGILAATVGVPPLMVSYDPKVDAFARLMDLGAASAVKGLSAQRLFDQFRESERTRDERAKKMAGKLEELSRLARRNIEILHTAAKL